MAVLNPQKVEQRFLDLEAAVADLRTRVEKLETGETHTYAEPPDDDEDKEDDESRPAKKRATKRR